MQLRKYVAVMYDKVFIYKHIGDGIFRDRYRGETSDIPNNLLEAEVKIIAARRKGILDIEIKGN